MDLYEIPLNRVPSQELDINIGAESLTVRLKTFRGRLYMDLSVNGTVLFNGILCVSGTPLNSPFRASGLNGDLIFTTENFKEPDYRDFGDKCRLHYVV